jgi:hypothetical protein
MQVCGMEEPLGWGKVPEELRFSKPGTSWALLSPCRESGLASMVLNSSTGSSCGVCHLGSSGCPLLFGFGTWREFWRVPAPHLSIYSPTGQTVGIPIRVHEEVPLVDGDHLLRPLLHGPVILAQHHLVGPGAPVQEASQSRSVAKVPTLHSHQPS